MRNTAFLAIGIALLIVQSNLFRLIGHLHIPGATPTLILPMIVFMGVHEYSMFRGAGLAFILGYLTDVFAAAPTGLFTFITVATFIISREGGVRRAAQTLLTRVALAFVFALFEGFLVYVFTAIFGGDSSRPQALAFLVLPHAISTALFSPVIFGIAERVHQATINVFGPGEGGPR